MSLPVDNNQLDFLKQLLAANPLSPQEWRHFVPAGTNNIRDVLLTNAQVNQFVQTNGGVNFWGNTGSDSVLIAWNSAAYDDANNRMYFFGGGHTDYGGNEVYMYDFDALSWSRLTDPAALVVQETDNGGGAAWSPLLSEGPAAPHTYDGLVWNPVTRTMWLSTTDASYDATAIYNPAFDGIWEFDPETGVWTAHAAQVGGGSIREGKTAVIESTGQILVFDQLVPNVYLWEPNGTQKKLSVSGSVPSFEGNLFTHPVTDQLYLAGNDGVYRINLVTGTGGAITGISGSKIAGSPTNLNEAGWAYRTVDGKFYSWNGGSQVVVFDPSNDSFTTVTNAGSPAQPGNVSGNGHVYDKWTYLEEVDAFAGIAAANDGGMWFYKPGAAQANTTQINPGTLAFDAATAHSLSFALPMQAGDTDRDGFVELFYRVAGSQQSWQQGPDLFQNHNGSGTSQTYAGMITGLQANTSYEIRVVANDPDGVQGTVQQTLTLATKAVPTVVQAGAGNTITVSSMAQLQAAVNGASPGDVIVLAPGTYTGTLTIQSHSGTSGAPITIRGAAEFASVLDAGGGNGIVIQDSDYIHIEGLAIRNAGVGISVRDWITNNGTRGVAIRDNLITDVVVGIEAKDNAGFGHHDLYIAGNVLVGTNVFGDTSQATWDDEGIVVAGQGIEVANNTLAGFGDSLGMTHAGANDPNRGVDIHHNMVLWGGDDGIELDFSDRNTAAHHNLLTNTASGISFQYVNDGPSYAFRNVIYNTERGPYKIKPEADWNDGVFIYNNTSIKSGWAWQNDTGHPDGIGIQNNLFVGDGTKADAVRLDTMTMINLIMDHNAWSHDGLFQVGGVGFFQNFADWQANSGQGAGDVLLVGQQIFQSIVLDFAQTGFGVWRDPLGADFSLAANSSAIDAGAVLTGITDGFLGAAPDIGAWEAGAAIPIYGAQNFVDGNILIDPQTGAVTVSFTPGLRIVAASADKAEGDSGTTPFTFTVERVGSAAGAVTVDYAVGGGTVNAADFGGALPSGTLSFADGQSSRTLTVNVSGDTLTEGDESFTVTLSNASGGTAIKQSTATGIIRGDDSGGNLSIAAGSTTGPEGNSGTSPRTFIVSRSGNTVQAVTVDYTVSGDVDAADFGGTLPAGTISFAAGETSKTLTLNVTGDTTPEPDENFTVTLSNPSGGAIIQQATASGKIWNDEMAFWINPANNDKAEGNSGSTAFTFTVERFNSSAGTSTVDYAVTGGTANAADFGGTLPSGHLVFGPGETLKTIIVNATGDTTFEPDETFNVTLQNPSSDAIIEKATESGIIRNDDPAAPSLSIAAASADKAEGNSGTTPFTFTVTRAGDTAPPVTVNYAMISGTAGASDFGGVLPSGQISFASGQTSKTITVNVTGDTSVESDETFTIGLSNPTGGAVIQQATATGTIRNDDANSTLSISAASADLAEGNSGWTGFTFTVTRTGSTSGTATVNYAVTGGTATAADFGGTLPSGQISLASGEASKTFFVFVSGDTTVEADENFTVTLSNPSAGVAIGQATATGMIRNDDAPAAAELSISALSADKAEGNSGTTPFTFTVTRGGDTTTAVTANYAMISGTAGASDFGGVLPSGQVSFAAGETSKTITVNVTGDTSVEADETFTIGLSSPTGGAVIQQATATGTIRNDDANSTLSISAASADMVEGNSGWTGFTFTVTRTGSTAGTALVDYAVTGGTANAADFGGTLPSGQISLASGEASKTFFVFVSGDTTFEADEDFTVTLSNPSTGVAIGQATATGVIRNDDAQPVAELSISALSADKAEGDSGTTSYSFTVTRSQVTNSAVTVDYAVTGGTANATDFGGTLPSGQVSFAAGQTSKTITIDVSGDTTFEADENFTVTLSNPSVGAAIVQGTASGTIRNDDAAPLADLSIAAVSADMAEGDTGSTTFTFTVTRSGVTSSAVSVGYQISGGTANAADFGGVLPSGQVNFAAGQTSKTITIDVSGDTAYEADETFTVALTNPSAGATIGQGTATGTIRNDDAARLSIAAANADLAEGNSGTTGFDFTVTRAGDTTNAVTVDYAVIGGAVNAADFGGALPSGQISFAAGETSKTITIGVSGDTVFEGDENFTVALSNASAGAVIDQSIAGGTIRDDDKAGLSIAGVSADKAEGDSGSTAFTFVVTRSGNSTTAVTADFAVTGGAANAADFGGALPSGQISFAAGQTSKTVTVNVAGDTVLEADEDFTVTLSNASANAVITQATATGTIRNDDAARLSIAPLSADKAEGNSGTTPYTFTVTRSGDTSSAVTADYAVTGVTANAADFGGVLPSGQVSFAAGQTSKTVTVNVAGDTVFEADEDFTVTLSNASTGAVIQQATATGTIRNDDAARLSIAPLSADKAEGDSGNTAYTFTVTRSGDTSSAVTADYAVTGVTANAADFGGALPSGQVSFAAGQTSKTITVNVSGDTVFEADEDFTVTLSNASSGATIQQATATGTIRNDDAARLSIAPLSADKSEGDSGNTAYTFTVTRSGDTSSAVTADYAVFGGAVNAADFGGALPSGQVSFAAGQTSKTITVNVSGDTVFEADEDFTVTLSNASSGATIQQATATGTIRNDDAARLSIAPLSADKAEGNSGNTAYTFTVTRSGDTSSAVTADYAVSGGAVNAADFGGALPSGQVSFAAGQTSKTITVNVSGDTVFEADEDFTVTLSNASANAVINQATATGTIRNDDAARLSIAPLSADKAEGNSGNTPYTFTVTRSGDTSSAVTADYAVTGVTANAADFGGTLPSGQVSFAAGQTSKTITVNVSADTVFEADETFTVALSNASANAVINQATATGTIRNDDSAQLSIAALDADKVEGNSGTTNYSFTVTRSGDTTSAVTVDYAVTGGTADATDFGGTLPSGQVSFAAGETSKTITIGVTADSTIETDEFFTVALSNPSQGAVIQQATATGIILDDDDVVVRQLSIFAADADKAEGDSGTTGYSFTVIRSGDVGAATTVDYAVSSSVADTTDFGGPLPSGQVTFAVGETSKTIVIDIAGDTVFESDETFTVTLSNPSQGTSIDQGTATGTIRNDDAAHLAIAAADADKLEGDSGTTGYSFTVTRSGDTASAVTVDYAVTGGTADAADFGGALPTGQVSFAAGETSKTITVDVAGDAAFEADESFAVALSNASTGATIDQATATGTIRNDDAAHLSIAALDADKTEGDSGTTAYSFTVTRSGDTSSAVTVDYAVAGGAATAADFGGALPSGQVSFAAGQTSKTITVNVTGDTAFEADESFTIALSNASTGAVIDQATATGTIRNDDAARLSIAALDADKLEGSSGTTGYTFTVTRSGDTSSAVTVDYAVAGGAATAADFGGALPAGQVSFAAGQTSKTITIDVSGDTAFEADESFTVALSNASAGAVIQQATATGIIRNDDAAHLSIAALDADKVEGDSGTTAYSFTVTRSGDTSSAVTANYAVVGGAANAADFGGALPTGQVSFAAGQTSKTITINVAGDTLTEGDENFTVALSNASTGAVIDQATAVGTIRNDDATHLTIAALSADRAEGDSGTTPFTFTVIRSGDTTGAVTVDYAVAGGTAVAADFGGALPSGQVSFASGETSKTVTINVAGDTVIEADEDFTVTLSNPSAGVVIDQATATGTIRNDDAALLSIAAANADKAEGDSGTTPFTFTVTRSGDTTNAVTVDYAVAGGTANAADFGGALPTGQVSFAAGQTSKTITIDVAGDTLIETNENFSVVLSNPSAGAVIQQATASGTIRNDDSSDLSIAALAADGAEGDNGFKPFTFSITRTGNTSDVVHVDYAVTGGTANAADFGPLTSGQVSFFSGETVKVITIPVSGDLLTESDETFTVTLSNATGNAVIQQATATGTIRNDDSANLSIAAANADKAEGDSGTTGYSFTVTRSGDTASATTVDYAVVGGTADTADFGGALPAGQVSFAAGETSKTITIDVTGDDVAENDESFVVALLNPSAGASIQQSTATGIIRNDDAATLSIAAAAADKAEGDSGATGYSFTVTRSGDTTNTVSVDYSISGGTATAGDFVGGLPSGHVIFAAGETSKTITLDVAGDIVAENDEDFIVSLSNPSLGAIIQQGTATGTIRNDDAAALSIVALSADKAEGNGSLTAFTFLITRAGATSSAVSVNYSVTGGTADTADFGLITGGNVIFSAGETSKIVSVLVAGDTLIESDENFTVSLSNASSGAVILQGNATGTIRNDDSGGAQLSIVAASADKAEGNGGSTAFTFTVTRTGDTSSSVSVNYGVSGGTADANDFGSFTSGQVSFFAGQTSKTVSIVVNGDSVIEPDETFTVSLSNPSTGATIQQGTATGTIRNDDLGPAAFSIAATDADKMEGDGGSTAYTFTVTRAGDTSSAVSVNYAVNGGTADAADFSSVTGGLLTFFAGQTSKTITIAVKGDTIVEADETFTVTLSNPSGSAVIQQASATGTIRNDDVQVSIVNGTNGNDMLVGTPGNDTLNGLSGNDLLMGSASADTLDGGSGLDSVSYAAATARVDARLINGWGFAGDALSDHYIGIENLTGSDFDDLLLGDNAANIIAGRGGDDNLNGQAGNDTLRGGTGDDYLVGGAGADVLDGGGGNDTASYVNAGARVDARLINGWGFAGDALGDSYIEIDNLVGSNFDDLLVGDNAANVLTGGAGNDNLNGQGGNDTLNGGSGDDYLVGCAGADVLDGGSGIDTASYVNAGTGVDARLINGKGFAGDALGDSYISIENLVGGKFDDLLVGDSSANMLEGGIGDDNLNGQAGDDTLSGGSGNDYLVGGAGADVLDGGSGIDTASYVNAGARVDARLINGKGFDGDALNDSYFGIENLVGSNFDDLLVGTNGANMLTGGAGNDNLNGQAGDDTLNGQSGDDYLVGGAGADVLDGGSGNDTASYVNAATRVDARLINGKGFAGDALNDIYIGIENLVGGNFDDLLLGDNGANMLTGGNGNDNLNGQAGDDTINGGAGNDVIYGGAGSDVLTGGTGNDLFVFRSGDGAETITDFAAGPGPGDKILFSNGAAAPNSFADVQAAASQVGADTVIDLGGGEMITLLGVNVATLHADDFLF